MKLNDLYKIAEQEHIEVLTFPMKENGSMSVMADDGTCYVGMDKSVIDGSVQELVHLGHELGHCITGSFYNIYSPLDVRQKHENQADIWLIKQAIPKCDLMRAVADGITELWDLAELFCVPLPFMQKAICYYKYGHLNTKVCFTV